MMGRSPIDDTLLEIGEGYKPGLLQWVKDQPLQPQINLKQKLDEIDKQVYNEVFDGFYESRLRILVGMWEKGKEIDVFRGGKSLNYSKLSQDTGRDRQHLKKWHDLYKKYPDKEKFIEEVAKPRALLWTQRTLRGKEIKQIETPLLPQGKFAVIYADPPWQYSNSGFDESAESQYRTISEEEIINLKDKAEKAIADLSHPETVLFLWATNPLVPEAIQVLEGWGFQYKTNMAWIKDRGRGKGWWLKSKHELLFIGVKEDTPKPKERFDSCFEAKRESTHSKKPEIVHEFIEKMYPGPLNETFYVELFARKSRPGWKAWGNEIL